MLAAVFAFSLMTFAVKMLVHLPAEALSFWRSMMMTAASIWLIKREKGNLFGENRLVLTLRGLLGGTSMISYFWAIHLLPLATATIFYYVSPILTALFAAWFLGEKLRPLTIFFFAVSFGGVLLVRGFDPRVSPIGFACGMITAVFSAGAYTAIGKLKGRESPFTIIFYLSAIASILSLAVLIFRNSWQMPVGSDWLWLLLTAAGAQIGQTFMTLAYFHEKSANVAIVNYTGIVFALGFGWFFWDETFSLEAFLGMGLVLAGVILNVVFTKKS